MTKIEKVMLIVTATMVVGFFIGVWYLNVVIEDAGGIKQMIINAGKEVKEISREIGKD